MPQAAPIACPHCGQSNFNLDWTGCVSVRFWKGKIMYVNHGGVTAVLPDQVHCNGCGDYVKWPEELVRAAMGEMDNQLPEHVRQRLVDGFESYQNETLAREHHAEANRRWENRAEAKTDEETE